jgi:hypothetical protein
MGYFIMVSDTKLGWSGSFASDTAVVGDIRPNAQLINNEWIYAFEADMAVYITPAAVRNSHNIHISVAQVFQDADGKIYLNGGVGMGTYWETERVIFPNHQVMGGFSSNSIFVSVYMMYEPIKIVTIQKDAEHNLLFRAEYIPGAGPASVYSLVPSTEYLIVETYRQSPSGEIYVTRDIYSRNDNPDHFTAFIAGQDGICRRLISQILWQGAGVYFQDPQNNSNSQLHRTLYEIELELKNDLMSRPDLIPTQPPYPHMAQFYFYRALVHISGYAFAIAEDGHVTVYMVFRHDTNADGSIEWTLVAYDVGLQGLTLTGGE